MFNLFHVVGWTGELLLGASLGDKVTPLLPLLTSGPTCPSSRRTGFVLFLAIACGLSWP